jgi:hypothetical protein
MSDQGFGLALVKEHGTTIKFDYTSTEDDSLVQKTTWFEFDVPDSMIDEVSAHLQLIGIDYHPRRGF